MVVLSSRSGSSALAAPCTQACTAGCRQCSLSWAAHHPANGEHSWVAMLATCRAHLVVGADGVRSAIRGSMSPGDPGPRFLVRGSFVLGHNLWPCYFTMSVTWAPPAAAVLSSIDPLLTKHSVSLPAACMRHALPHVMRYVISNHPTLAVNRCCPCHSSTRAFMCAAGCVANGDSRVA